MDIETLQRLAGINKFNGYTEYKIDENPSETASEKRRVEREQNIKPGDKEWFELWFSKPYMTGAQFRGRKSK